MHTFGRTSFIAYLVILAGMAGISPMLREADMLLPLGIPLAMLLGQLFYSPIIRLNDDRLRISTLTPFVKNLDVAVADIQRMDINIQYTVQFTIVMKDGTVHNLHTGRYALDMNPLYIALREKNIAVSSEGYDTVDWTQ